MFVSAASDGGSYNMWDSLRAVVFLQQLAHAVVRKGIDAMAIPARHALVRDEGIHDRFFHGLNGRAE